MNKLHTLLLTSCLLTGCDLAPDMQNMAPSVPASYKEAPSIDKPDMSKPAGEEAKPIEDGAPVPEKADWKKAEPADDKDRGPWWRVFGDESLNALQLQAQTQNQTAKAAAARVEQARAAARFESAGLFPDISIDASGRKAKQSFPGFDTSPQKPYRFYQALGVISYELDLFGRISNRSFAAKLLAEGEDANYQSVLLTLQADIAQHYFSLRAIDEELRTLRETVGVRSQAENVMKRRMETGFTGELDYARAQADLASVRADTFALEKERARQEHALAILLGKAPGEFTFAPSPLEAGIFPPEIPVGLPSSLLERRPDIARAQRAMEAANAEIGVARAAFFPSVSLNASGGFESSKFSDVFKWSSRSWAFGPDIHIPIFEGGSAFANLDRRKAMYDEAVAAYRQQVLVAFREVEDGLSDTRLLALQQDAQALAAASSKRASELADMRYDQGDLNYLDVVDAKRSQLASERALAQIKGQRYIATTQLIRALGGGW